MESLETWYVYENSFIIRLECNRETANWFTTICNDLELSSFQEGNISNVKLDLMWRSDEGIFNYDTDMSPYAAARAFAKEVWNKQYFKDLEKAHQTHYEQMGRIDGELEFYHDKKDDDINMGGKNIEKIALQMPSFRDHSYGMLRNCHLRVIW